MKKLIVGLMVVGILGVMVVTSEAATEAARVDLYVTPVVTTSLTISTTYYNFGDVDVDTSTGDAAQNSVPRHIQFFSCSANPWHPESGGNRTLVEVPGRGELSILTMIDDGYIENLGIL